MVEFFLFGYKKLCKIIYLFECEIIFTVHLKLLNTIKNNTFNTKY